MFEDLINILRNDKYLTLETTPPHNPSMDKIINNIQKYNLDKKVVGFSATDNPLAKLKYSSFFGALKLQQHFNKPVITTLSMRDRNKIALQSDLIGANDFDIRAILALTGDPAKMSDQPHTKGVFEGNSNMLLDIIHSFNCGMDYSGKLFDIKPKEIYPFSVINSYAKNFKSLEKKMYQKIQHNTTAIITQPIYEFENGKKLIELFNKVKSDFKNSEIDRSGVEIIIGIFPITKLRTAQFLSSRVPGIFVPQYWIDKLEKASKISAEEEYKVGIELSKDIFNKIYDFHPKIHLMTANRFDIANKIII